MKSRDVAFAAILLGVAASTPIASALPAIGSATPSARVEDADGHALDLKTIGAKPILVLYEDKDSATLNQPLKDDLSRLAKGDKYKKTVALVPVADVSGYNFWPVRGFVKDAIRDESKKAGATIYCDWTGSFRGALGLRRGTSSVMLFGRDGKVLFAKDGALDAKDRGRLIDLLRGQVGG